MKTVLILNHNQENFGTYFRCFFLGQGLASRGYRIKMICASGKNFDLLIRKKRIGALFTIYTLPRIKYHQYFTGQLLRLFLTLPFILFAQYDICHAFTLAQPQIAFPAFLAKTIRKKKLIIDWDDLWGGGFGEEHHSLVAKVLFFCERYFLQYADRITYVSQLIKNEIDIAAEKYTRIKKIKTCKISNGANTRQISVLEKNVCRAKIGWLPEKKYILSMGNTYTEGLGILARAFIRIIQKRKDVYLVLLGELLIPQKFKKIFKQIQNQTIILGRQLFSRVPTYLSGSDVLVLPMDDNNIEKARFPMRFGDYLCASRPIASNAVGEVKFYLEKYSAGLVSPPQSSRRLAENIQKILDDDQLAARISQNARQLAENDLNWQKSFQHLENIYANLV